MKIRLASEVVEKIPGIRVAVLVMKNLQNTYKSSVVLQLLRGVFAMRKKDLQKDATQQKIDALLQKTHNGEAVLPEVHLLQSLLKKCQKDLEVKNENNLLDLAHYLDLKLLTPAMGYDLDEVEKDIELQFALPKKGKKGPDFNFTPETKNIVIWMTYIGSTDLEDFEKVPAQFAAILGQYCKGSTSDIFFLDADEREADLSYISEKEKAYHLQQSSLRDSLDISQKSATSAADLTSDSTPGGEMPTKFSTKPIPVEAPSLPDTHPTIQNNFNATPTKRTMSELPIREQLKSAIAMALQELAIDLKVEFPVAAETIELQPPREKDHGDYATNVALKLGKQLHQNPRQIAEKITQYLPKLSSLERTEIAGAGFINFYLSQEYLKGELKQMLEQKENYGRLDFGHGQKVIIEFSSPNIAKPLGAHHLMTTILGQILVNLYRFGHYEVIAGNYLGDWGTQFGKLIYAYNTWGHREQIEKDPLNELLKLYIRFHDEAEKDPTLEDQGRTEFKKLEEGDAKNRELWQWIRDISVKDLERLYQKLDVHFDEYFPESRYEQSMKEVLEEGKQKGVFVPGERGALIVQFDNDQYPPYLMQKADGATLYSTRDLASVKDRVERFHPHQILYVVDVAQSLHLQQLFATAKKMGYDHDQRDHQGDGHKVDLIHVVFGRMQLPDGNMSTRKGTVVLLDKLIQEAEERAAKIVEAKSPELSTEEKKKISEGLALGAIKYHIVSQNRETNLIFDWDRMLALDGNSAPYLAYAYARARSILRKAAQGAEASEIMAKNQTQEAKAANPTLEEHPEGGQNTGAQNAATPAPSAEPVNTFQSDIFEAVALQESLQSQRQPEAKSEEVNAASNTTSRAALTSTTSTPTSTSRLQISAKSDEAASPFAHPAEHTLLRMLMKFPEAIEQAIAYNKPNLLTSYLYELTQNFSSFYQEVPVLNASQPELRIARLQLVEAFTQILKNGLHILGIETFERM